MFRITLFGAVFSNICASGIRHTVSKRQFRDQPSLKIDYLPQWEPVSMKMRIIVRQIKLKLVVLVYIWYKRLCRAYNRFSRVDTKFVGVHIICNFRVHRIRNLPHKTNPTHRVAYHTRKVHFCISIPQVFIFMLAYYLYALSWDQVSVVQSEL